MIFRAFSSILLIAISYLLAFSLVTHFSAPATIQTDSLTVASDFHTMDRLAESGGIELAFRLSRRSSSDHVDTRTDRSLIECLFSDWQEFEYAFEPCVRYLGTDELRNGEQEASTRVIRSLTDPECALKSCDVRFAVCLALLSINGYPCSTDPILNESTYIFLATRILQSEKHHMWKDLELDEASGLFYSLSDATEERLILDIDSILNEITTRNMGLYYSATVGTLLDITGGIGNKRGFDFICKNTANSSLNSDCWNFGDTFETLVANEYSRYLQWNPLRKSDLHPMEATFNPPSTPVDINTIGKAGLTFAYVAYSSGQLHNLEYLLDKGADPDQKLTEDVYPLAEVHDFGTKCQAFSPRRGDTMLLSASLDPFRKPFFLPLLLKYTRKPDARDLLNRNALHRFLYHRVDGEQKQLLKLLIDAGVNVNAKSVSGNTPCHVAANRNAHLIPELVKAGADLTAKNDRGETPIDLLKRSVDEKWIFHEENAVVLRDLEKSSASGE